VTGELIAKGSGVVPNSDNWNRIHTNGAIAHSPCRRTMKADRTRPPGQESLAESDFRRAGVRD
jgi:hypothetical protein